jgi:hypothetical protein
VHDRGGGEARGGEKAEPEKAEEGVRLGGVRRPSPRRPRLARPSRISRSSSLVEVVEGRGWLGLLSCAVVCLFADFG